MAKELRMATTIRFSQKNYYILQQRSRKLLSLRCQMFTLLLNVVVVTFFVQKMKRWCPGPAAAAFAVVSIFCWHFFAKQHQQRRFPLNRQNGGGLMMIGKIQLPLPKNYPAILPASWGVRVTVEDNLTSKAHVVFRQLLHTTVELPSTYFETQ